MKSHSQILKQFIKNEKDNFASEATITRRGHRLKIPGIFSGWSEPVTLASLNMMRKSGKFFQKGRRLYRIAISGRKNPVYIGMTSIGVYKRVMQHYRGRKNKRDNLHIILKKLGVTPKDVRVQVGCVLRGNGSHCLDTIPMKLLHIYELTLQMREMNTKWNRKYKLYNPNVWTFDDFEEMNFEAKEI